MQEIHHFLQRLLGLILTGNIFKCHTSFFLYIGFCFALAYAAALTHKATQMAVGGQRKAAVAVAQTVEEVKAI